MEFLTKTWRQAVDLFQSMTPAARITTAVLAAAVVVSLGYLFYWQTGGGDELLLGGREFSQGDLTAMEKAFGKASLSGSTIDGNRIRVPRGEKEKYLAALADHGALPADFSSYYDEVLQNESGFLGSRDLREQKLKNAKEKHLSLVISHMHGIDYATVRFDREESRGRWIDRDVDVRAGVAVMPEGIAQLDAERVAAIRNTVASFIAGLKKENVTVTDLKSGIAHVGGGDGPYGGDADYAAKKMQYERMFREKLTARLASFPGVVVGVNVELNPQLLRRETSLKIDPKSVPLMTRENRESLVSTEPEQGGRPGAVPNGVVPNSGATLTQESGAKTEKTVDNSESRSVVSQDHSLTETAPLTPSEVRVSIGVPSSYYRKVWLAAHPAADGETPTPPPADELRQIEQNVKTQIQEAVVAMLPEPARQSDDKYQPVLVSTFPDVPPEIVEPPGMIDEVWVWLAANWQTLGMVVAALAGLVVLRRMLKSRPQETAPAGDAAPPIQLADLPDEESEEAGEDGKPPRKLRRILEGGPNLRDELTELVKEHPEAAVNVLRSWIGEAA